jgi:hypothetical protein
METSTAAAYYDGQDSVHSRTGARHPQGTAGIDNYGRGTTTTNTQNPDVIVRAAQKRRSSIENATNISGTV